jgi:signal transduction histidine kinase
MTRLFAPYLDRLNAAYRGRTVFEGLKARLLASIALLVLVFVPLNVAKNLWIQPPVLGPRLVLNLVIWIGAAACLRAVYKGTLNRAGNVFALTLVIAVHVLLLVVGATTKPVQPVGTGVQTLVFDFVILLFALLFASRRVATTVFAVVMAGILGYHLFLGQQSELGPSDRVTADTLLREGMIAMGLIFALGITLMQMIDAAHLRSEEALRQSREMNENLGRLEREARMISEQRRELLEAQREFISMVSHEFRTPLTTIQGAQFLLEKLLRESATLGAAVAAETRKWLDMQTSGLDTLTKLVDQVLLLNRTEHMTGEASFEALSPSAVLAAAVRPFNETMAAPRVILRDMLPAGFSATMDPRLVKAAVENLISNGLKYSAIEKTVTIDVYAEPEGWAVEVVDEGRGIPKEDQASLFRPFFRAGNIGTVPGTGLGLVIVRRAVDFHGGKIEFESRENLGTRFKLHFPAVARSTLDAPAPACISAESRS